MIEQLVAYIQSLIAAYGPWGVLLATIIEEIIAPVPSAIVPLAAGFFLLPGDMAFIEVVARIIFVIALPVTVGISMGSVAVYALGYFGGKPIIERSKKITGISWVDVEKIEARISGGRTDELTLFVLRLIPIVPGVAISGFCGLVRYSFKKFLIITCVGAFIRALALGIVGWRVGELYTRYATVISGFEKQILLGSLVLAPIIFMLYRRTRHNIA